MGVLLIALVSLGACNRATSGKSEHERKVTTVTWDTVWVRGGPSDTLLLMPLDVVANARHVYVLDAGAKRVVALRTTDGSLAWTAGGAGPGPKEFNAPTALALTPAGDVLVADHKNARISVINPQGLFTGHIPFTGFDYVQGICSLEDDDILVTTLSRERPVVRLSSHGVLIQRLPLPWPELRSIDPVGRQALLSGSDDFKTCTLALALGRGFAVYRSGGFSIVSDYVEALPTPEVAVSVRESRNGRVTSARLPQRNIAATNASVSAGILSVSFEGKTASAGRLIDRYDLETGTYLETYEFSRPITALTQSGRTVMLLHYAAGYPTLLATVPSARPE
jgi:hypothetical protein